VKASQQKTQSRSVQELLALRRQKQLRSTAAILARGVSLSEVQEAVKRLRPHVQHVS